MIVHEICSVCKGACCLPEHLEFPVAEGSTEQDALVAIGLPDATSLGIRIDQHGRRVMRVRCPRQGRCDEATRPGPCLSFPEHYLDDDHTDAERDEIRPFCALFRLLEEGTP